MGDVDISNFERDNADAYPAAPLTDATDGYSEPKTVDSAPLTDGSYSETKTVDTAPLTRRPRQSTLPHSPMARILNQRLRLKLTPGRTQMTQQISLEREGTWSSLLNAQF